MLLPPEGSEGGCFYVKVRFWAEYEERGENAEEKREVFISVWAVESHTPRDARVARVFLAGGKWPEVHRETAVPSGHAQTLAVSACGFSNARSAATALNQPFKGPQALCNAAVAQSSSHNHSPSPQYFMFQQYQTHHTVQPWGQGRSSVYRFVPISHWQRVTALG